jgi:hypothetical protein
MRSSQVLERQSVDTVQPSHAPRAFPAAQVPSASHTPATQSAAAWHGTPAPPGAHAPSLQTPERQSVGCVQAAPAPPGAAGRGAAGGATSPVPSSPPHVPGVRSTFLVRITGRRIHSSPAPVGWTDSDLRPSKSSVTVVCVQGPISQGPLILMPDSVPLGTTSGFSTPLTTTVLPALSTRRRSWVTVPAGRSRSPSGAT